MKMNKHIVIYMYDADWRAKLLAYLAILLGGKSRGEVFHNFSITKHIVIKPTEKPVRKPRRKEAWTK